MNYRIAKRRPLDIIGIKLDVQKPAEALKLIGSFWNRFHTQGIKQQIPNKLKPEHTIALYTNYDKTGGYALIIGAAVTNTITVPPGMVAITIPEQTYMVFPKQGKLPDIIIDTWKYIWQQPIARAFTYDFEVYKNDSAENADVEIYLALKPDYEQA